MKSNPRVIAAIPCFNTMNFIEDIVSKTRQHVDRVIVIDDGSSDRTAEVAAAAGALVISHDHNRGYGEAIKSCLQAGRDNAADVLVILDGDAQHDPDDIPRLLEPVLNDDADIVIGSRFLSDESNMPRYRRFGIQVINFLFNFASVTKVSDSQSGFRAYSGRALEVIAPVESGMSVSLEVLLRARIAGLKIREAPISCRYHKGSSTMNPIKHGLGLIFSLIRLRAKAIFRG